LGWPEVVPAAFKAVGENRRTLLGEAFGDNLPGAAITAGDQHYFACSAELHFPSPINYEYIVSQSLARAQVFYVYVALLRRYSVGQIPITCLNSREKY